MVYLKNFFNVPSLNNNTFYFCSLQAKQGEREAIHLTKTLVCLSQTLTTVISGLAYKMDWIFLES